MNGGKIGNQSDVSRLFEYSDSPMTLTPRA